MTELFDIVRQVLVPMFYKETQLGRSLRKNDLELKKRLFESCINLADRADKGTIRNEDVRKEISDISLQTKVSVGQTQKMINVFLKYYCILTKKPTEVIKNLDCPLDSQIMKRFKTKNLKKISLKAMTSMTDYIAWQDHLENIGEGIRLLPDIQAYDKERIELFFKS